MTTWQNKNCRATIVCGNSAEVLPTYPSGVFDALVTDPPAGIGFMGKDWDDYRRSHNPADVGRDNTFGRLSRVAPEIGRARDGFIAMLTPIMVECLRLLKPGAHGLVWALPRTSHWTATALEEAGFEVRDRIAFLFGTGFPKALSVSKAIDAAAGATRAVVGDKLGLSGYHLSRHDGGVAFGHGLSSSTPETRLAAAQITAPATDAAKEWEGWHTALKPACEDWWLVRKPLEGTVAANVLKHGCGGLNIDGCRIETTEKIAAFGSPKKSVGGLLNSTQENRGRFEQNALGRWPANVCLDEDAAQALDEQAGVRTSGMMRAGQSRIGSLGDAGGYGGGRGPDASPRGTYGDTGGASRFFYVAKPTRSERDRGCRFIEKKSAGEMTDREDGSAGLNSPRTGAGRTSGAKNIHPTVKPIELMRWLCRLITPPNGLILDPFTGSGTTGVAALEEGFQFFGIEKESEYFEIAKARLAAAMPYRPELF